MSVRLLALALLALPQGPSRGGQGVDPSAPHAPGVDNLMLSPDSLPPGHSLHARGENLVAFEVDELSQGADLNSDGDLEDGVLHVIDPELNIRTLHATSDSTPYGSSGGLIAVVGDVVYYAVREASEGGQDLNGDGSAYGHILHRYDARLGTPENLMIPVNTFKSSSKQVVFGVRESTIDLNGDGDLLDFVLQAVSEGGAVSNLGVAGAVKALGTEFGIVGVEESQQGGIDLNGDGDAKDTIAHVFDYETGTVENLALPVTGVRVVDGVAYLSVMERGHRQDLNGDGDLVDRVGHVYRHSESSVTNTRLAEDGVESPVMGSDHIVIHVDEEAQGGTDLNGNGVVGESVHHAFDISSSVSTNLRTTRRTSRWNRVVDGRFVSITPEPRDVNGDGDTDDTVARIIDLRTKRMSFVPASVLRFDAMGRTLVLLLSETGDGKDWNGDGDTTDNVVGTYDMVSRRLRSLGLAGEFRVSEEVLLVSAYETWQGNLDLNGDSDSLDPVLHYVSLPSGRSTNLGIAAITYGVHASWGEELGLIPVRERLQGGEDLNGDGDSIDDVYYLLRGSR